MKDTTLARDPRFFNLLPQDVLYHMSIAISFVFEISVLATKDRNPMRSTENPPLSS